MIHVVTPFSRPWNAPALLSNLERQGTAVTWHPIVATGAVFPVERGWIRPLVVDVPEGTDPFCWKLGAFFGRGDLAAGERYVVLCDDDLFGPGTLAAVAGMVERVVVISMLRGQASPARTDGGYAHPASTLWAGRDHMRVGEVSLQQCFVAGEIYGAAPFDPRRAPFCDGLVAEWLAEAAGESIRYVRDLFVLFNRLEPGRWVDGYDEAGVGV